MTMPRTLVDLHKAGRLRGDIAEPALSRATLLINLERVDGPVGITKRGRIVRHVVLAGRGLGGTAGRAPGGAGPIAAKRRIKNLS